MGLTRIPALVVQLPVLLLRLSTRIRHEFHYSINGAITQAVYAQDIRLPVTALRKLRYHDVRLVPGHAASQHV